MKNKKIDNYLENLVKEGKIKEFYLDKFNYWDFVPFIKLNNNKTIVLAKTFYFINNLCIKTIWDYKNITYAKRKIEKTIKNEYFE